MEFCLRLPYCFKLIQIVLTIVNALFNPEMRVLLELTHQILPHCAVAEYKFLAVITYAAKVAARLCQVTIYCGKHCRHLFDR